MYRSISACLTLAAQPHHHARQAVSHVHAGVLLQSCLQQDVGLQRGNFCSYPASRILAIKLARCSEDLHRCCCSYGCTVFREVGPACPQGICLYHAGMAGGIRHQAEIAAHIAGLCKLRPLGPPQLHVGAGRRRSACLALRKRSLPGTPEIKQDCTYRSGPHDHAKMPWGDSCARLVCNLWGPQRSNVLSED